MAYAHVPMSVCGSIYAQIVCVHQHRADRLIHASFPSMHGGYPGEPPEVGIYMGESGP